MKVIFHVGPPKTGTTALQRAMFIARDSMIAHSVLYPEPVPDNAYNHGALCATFVPFSDAPRAMKAIGEARYDANGKMQCDQIAAQVAEYRPETLILSSEWFARAHSAVCGHRLIAFAESLGPESIEILLYARRPSGFFLSAAQQRLRASCHFEPIFEWNVHALIDDFRSLAPQHRVTVRSFDRQALEGGSIISDFAAHYAPNCRGILENTTAVQKQNESFSAETMAILQDFRRVRFASQDDIFNKPTRRLVAKLKRHDEADGNPRPKLLPEWQDYLDYGDHRALSLRDEHGLSFRDFDYARLERGDFASKPANTKDVADFVTVDTERLQRMISELGLQYWNPFRKNTRWIRGLAKRKGLFPSPNLPR